MPGVRPRGNQVPLPAHDPIAHVVSRNCAGVDHLIRQGTLSARLRQQRSVFVDHFLRKADLCRMSAAFKRRVIASGNRRRLLPGRGGRQLPESSLPGSRPRKNRSCTYQASQCHPTSLYACHRIFPHLLIENRRLRQHARYPFHIGRATVLSLIWSIAGRMNYSAPQRSPLRGLRQGRPGCCIGR